MPDVSAVSVCPTLASPMMRTLRPAGLLGCGWLYLLFRLLKATLRIDQNLNLGSILSIGAQLPVFAQLTPSGERGQHVMTPSVAMAQVCSPRAVMAL